MKRITAFVAAEVLILGGGAAGDKMFPDVPLWAILTVTACAGIVAVTMFVWSLFDDKADAKKVQKAIEKALKDRDYRVEKLRQVVRSLPQKPLGTDGTTYAALPAGRNVVTLPDGSIRLALPVRIQSSLGSTGVGGATLKRPLADDGEKD